MPNHAKIAISELYEQLDEDDYELRAIKAMAAAGWFDDQTADDVKAFWKELRERRVASGRM